MRANRQLLAALQEISALTELSNQDLGFFLYHWNNPHPSQRVVKIAPGERGKYWEDCLKNGYICVSWDEVGDLSQFESKEAFREAFRQHFPYNGVEHHVSRKANELWTLMELQPGDTVIANRGVSEVLGVGTVNDVGYVWRPEREQYKHTVGVDWDTSVARTIEPVRGLGHHHGVEGAGHYSSPGSRGRARKLNPSRPTRSTSRWRRPSNAAVRPCCTDRPARVRPTSQTGLRCGCSRAAVRANGPTPCSQTRPFWLNVDVQ